MWARDASLRDGGAGTRGLFAGTLVIPNRFLLWLAAVASLLLYHT